MLIEINRHRTVIIPHKYNPDVAIADSLGGYHSVIKREAIKEIRFMDDIFTICLRGNKRRTFYIRNAQILYHFLDLLLYKNFMTN